MLHLFYCLDTILVTFATCEWQCILSDKDAFFCRRFNIDDWSIKNDKASSIKFEKIIFDNLYNLKSVILRKKKNLYYTPMTSLQW